MVASITAASCILVRFMGWPTTTSVGSSRSRIIKKRAMVSRSGRCATLSLLLGLTYTPGFRYRQPINGEMLRNAMNGLNVWQNLANIAGRPGEIPIVPKRMLGYVRVSPRDPDNRYQIAEMVGFGVSRRNIFEDVDPGRNTPRPGWDACWNTIQRGDLLVINSIDRLGRDLGEVMRTVYALYERRINFRVLSINIDTRTPGGMLLFEIMVEMAQWDRELMRERANHGLRRSRERGVRGGARQKHTDEAIMAAIAQYGLNSAGRHLSPTMSKTQMLRRRNAYLEKLETALAQEQAA